MVVPLYGRRTVLKSCVFTALLFNGFLFLTNLNVLCRCIRLKVSKYAAIPQDFGSRAVKATAVAGIKVGF